MTDEDLHAVVYRETRQVIHEADDPGRGEYGRRVLQNMKDSVNRGERPKRTDEGGDARTVQQRRKIYVLTQALGWDNDPRRIQGFVKRMTGVDRLEWLNVSQCEKVIEGLKAILAREQRKGAGRDG